MNEKLMMYIVFLLQMSLMFSVLFIFAKPKGSAIKVYLILIVQGMIASVIAHEFPSAIAAFLNFVVSIIAIYLLFEGTNAQRLLLSIGFYVFAIVNEVITTFTMTSLFKLPKDFFTNPQNNLRGIVIATTFMLIEVTMIWLISPKLNKKSTIKISSKTIFKFMLYPVSQFLLFWCLVLQAYFSNLNIEAIFLFVAVVISLLTDLYMFNNMIEIEKKNIADQRVKSLEYMTYIQNNEYNHMMEANENIRKLKHDYNNFLNSSVLLLEQEDISAQKEGLQLIKQLQNRVSTGYKSFCKNYVVNAVLNEKYATCIEKDIQFACTVNIPNEIKVDSIQLCSIFSNALDNAIRAVSNLAIEKRMIEVDAKIDNNFLIIKVVNPYKKETLEDRPHLGLSIIKEIATSYDGELIINENGDEFTVMICLNLS